METSFIYYCYMSRYTGNWHILSHEGLSGWLSPSGKEKINNRDRTIKRGCPYILCQIINVDSSVDVEFPVVIFD